MDILQDLFSTSSAVDAIPLTEMVRSTFLTFFLALAIGYVYRITHQGPSYSQSTVHTMVIMAVVVCLIMLIIGTNIARAFSLVGALSIIRFRNAVKDSRDVAFYFLSMGIGMSCGTGHLAIATVFTLIMSAMIYFMVRFQIGGKQVKEIMLRIVSPEGVDYHQAFDAAFFKHLESSDLLSVDSDGSGALELIYTITLRKGDQEQALLSDLQGVHEALRAQVIHGHDNIVL